MAVSKHFTRARTIKGMEMKGKMFKAGDLWSPCFYCLRQKNILHASCRTVKLGVKKTMKKKGPLWNTLFVDELHNETAHKIPRPILLFFMKHLYTDGLAPGLQSGTFTCTAVHVHQCALS